MTDNALKTALREAVSREFEDIPQSESEIDYSFSDAFTRKMNKLTKAEQSRLWRMTNTVPKRAAAILFALTLITLTACSIPTVRAAVVGFIKETYHNCIHLFTGEAKSKGIVQHYALTELPSGFIEIAKRESEASCFTHYQNMNGDDIFLTQSITNHLSIHMDSEHGIISEMNLSGINITIYESDNCIIAVWLQDGYAFDLTIRGNCDTDLIVRLIESIQLQ